MLVLLCFEVFLGFAVVVSDVVVDSIVVIVVSVILPFSKYLSASQRFKIGEGGDGREGPKPVHRGGAKTSRDRKIAARKARAASGVT